MRRVQRPLPLTLIAVAAAVAVTAFAEVPRDGLHPLALLASLLPLQLAALWLVVCHSAPAAPAVTAAAPRSPGLKPPASG